MVAGKENYSLLPVLCFVHFFRVVNFFMEVTDVCTQTIHSNIKVSDMKLHQCPFVVWRVLWISHNCWLASHCWLYKSYRIHLIDAVHIELHET